MSSTLIESNPFGQISKHVLPNEIVLLNIEHNNVKASVSLYGGQVLSWQPKGEKPVFWLSESADFQLGKAIRGGVPICWPWFGENLDSDGNNGGNHGFARNLSWQFVAVDIEQDRVKVVLELIGENQHRLWPSAFKLTQELYFGEAFSQTLLIENLSSTDAQFSSALHSYFAVSDPKFVEVSDLNGRKFDDKITKKLQQRDVLNHCVGPIDRIYHHDGKQAIIDHQWQRKIHVSMENCQQWVLWNPGKDIASKMSDVHQGGEQEFVCLEAANTEWQSLPAGQSISLRQIIEVEPIT